MQVPWPRLLKALLLVLPHAETMTPALLRKIKELVAQGATVVGAPPRKSPSLSGYPGCDQEVQALARELWGQGEPPSELTSHRFGRGRIFWGGPFKPKPRSAAELPNPLTAAKWIWFNEGNPTASAPAARRFFQRTVEVDAAPLAAASLVMTADNSFECTVNGQAVGSGDNWAKPYEMDLKPWLRPGKNLVAVTAVNTTASPSPAGLIGAVRLVYDDERTVLVPTDSRWQASDKQPVQGSPDASWAPALELGPLGMGPWGDGPAGAGSVDTIPDLNLLCRLLAQQGVPPDFEAGTRHADQGLRFVHRTLGDTEVYLVANKNPHPEEALASFRVTGRRPELWWPDTGRIEPAVVYDGSRDLTRVPLRLDGHGSVFVVFRKGARFERDRLTAVSRNGEPILTSSWTGSASVPAASAPAPEAEPRLALSRDARGDIQATVSEPGRYMFQPARGRARQFETGPLPAPLAIRGPWEVRFAPNWGAPERVTLEELISWSDHPDPGVKFFSGTATYTKTITVPSGFTARDHRLRLSLGRVAVIAEVAMNGRPLGTLWKAPFDLDVTDAVKPGDNEIEVKVVNLWINRQIGDEHLAEDSERNPDGTLKAWPDWIEEGRRSPSGRYTFTSWRLWKKTDNLVPSGLLGPVELRVLKHVTLDRQSKP